jgi:hypothetical protein
LIWLNNEHIVPGWPPYISTLVTTPWILSDGSR